MARLSLLRLVLLATTSVVATQASLALAQVPIFAPPEAAPEHPAPESPEPSPPAPPAEPTAPAVSPATPAPAGPSSSAEPSLSPAPAKTDRIAGLEAKPAEAEDEGDDDIGDDDENGKRRRRWYGWQTLTADGVSLGLLFTAVVIESGSGDLDTDLLVTTGLLGYELVPGIIHIAHGNTGRGFASFGLRLGMPLAGAFLGAATSSGCDEHLCEAEGAAVGFLLGMGGAIALDAAVFAYEDRRSRLARAPLAPLLTISARRAWIGIGGEL